MADPLPPHQEQPRPARRAGRGQDRDRRGPGPVDHQARGPRPAGEQAHHLARPRLDGRRHQVPRPVRGAHQGGDEGGQDLQEHHPLHRRAAHPGRGRRRRGRDRRQQRAQAGAVARRDAVHRRDHPGRVPQVHREGRRPRAPLPVDRRRPALDRGRDQDPGRPARQVRGPPPHQDHRPGDRRGGQAQRPLHHRPLPARQGHRRDRRGRRQAAPEGDLAARPPTRRSTSRSRSSRSRSPRPSSTRTTKKPRSSATAPRRRRRSSPTSSASTRSSPRSCAAPSTSTWSARSWRR